MPELSLVTERGPLGAAASSVDEHRLQEVQHEGSAPVAPGLCSTGSAVVAHRPRCSTAQGSSQLRDRTALAGGLSPTYFVLMSFETSQKRHVSKTLSNMWKGHIVPQALS